MSANLPDDRVDAAIDAALEELAEIKPGPHFVPRLRAHVEQSARARSSTRWMVPMSIVGSVVVCAVLFEQLQDRNAARMTHAANAVAVRKPTVTASEAPAAMPSRDDDQPAGARRLQPSVRAPGRVRLAKAVALRPSSRSSAADVVVARNQRDAIGRLLSALNAGDPEALSMMRRVSAPPVESPPAAIVVAPIRIDPVLVVPLVDK